MIPGLNQAVEHWKYIAPVAAYGKRSLNLRQIKILAKRFNVSPDTFID